MENCFQTYIELCSSSIFALEKVHMWNAKVWVRDAVWSWMCREPPAALCMCEKQTAGIVCIQFSRLYPQVKSENGLCVFVSVCVTAVCRKRPDGIMKVLPCLRFIRWQSWHLSPKKMSPCFPDKTQFSYISRFCGVGGISQNTCRSHRSKLAHNQVYLNCNIMIDSKLSVTPRLTFPPRRMWYQTEVPPKSMWKSVKQPCTLMRQYLRDNKNTQKDWC